MLLWPALLQEVSLKKQGHLPLEALKLWDLKLAWTCALKQIPPSRGSPLEGEAKGMQAREPRQVLSQSPNLFLPLM